MLRERKLREVIQKEKWDSRNYRFTTNEAMMYIASKKEWYRGLYKQQTASAIMKRFKEGKLSNRILERVLSHYGFYEHQPRMFRINKTKQNENLNK